MAPQLLRVGKNDFMALTRFTLLRSFWSLRECHLHETFPDAPYSELHPPWQMDLPARFCSMAFITEFPLFCPFSCFVLFFFFLSVFGDSKDS